MKQNKLRILTSSDDHLSNKNPKFKINNLGVSELLMRQHSLSQMIASELKDNFDIYINCGDLTDYANLDPITSTYTNKYIKNIVDTGKPCIFLEGNHCINDTKNAFTVLGAISSLADFNNCKFVFQDEILKLDKNFQFVEEDCEAEVVIYCFPYFSDLKALSERIHNASLNADSSKFNLMLFHFPCSNAFLDNGMVATRGLELSKQITEGFDLCLGGDYHKHQELVNNSKAYYIGAPFDLKHGEHYDRGIVSVEINLSNKRFKLDKIKNPYLLPILDLTFEEILKLEDEYLSNCVVRVKDEIDNKKKMVLDSRSFHKLSVVNFKKEKKKDERLQDVKVIQSNFSSSDRELLRDYFTNKYPDDDDKVNGIIGFFDKYRT